MMQHTRENVIRSYLKAMEIGDIKATVACFVAQGIIVSPVYGEVAAGKFYERLFADTVRAVVDIHAIYASLNDTRRWAAHFMYQWERKDGSLVTTDLVDLFEFEESSNLITRLKIVFDPTPKPQTN